MDLRGRSLYGPRWAANAKQFIDDLGLDGIDIDNEDSNPLNENFFEVIKALRAALGPKGSPGSLLTYVTYKPGRDIKWLKEYGYLFDHVSTMAYWLDYDSILPFLQNTPLC